MAFVWSQHEDLFHVKVSIHSPFSLLGFKNLPPLKIGHDLWFLLDFHTSIYIYINLEAKNQKLMLVANNWR